ncbi:hypothetical protein VaNZ11_010209, partial [Volvox africanus]
PPAAAHPQIHTHRMLVVGAEPGKTTDFGEVGMGDWMRVPRNTGEGITPQHLGVLNLSFNRLASLPPALGGSEGSWGITGGSTVRSANDSDTLAMEEEDAERAEGSGAVL